MTGDDVVNAQQQDGRLRDRQEGGQRQVTAGATDQCQVGIDQLSDSDSDLHSRLVGLSFYSERLPDSSSRHVGQTAGLSVHAPARTIVLSVFGLNTQSSQHY